LKILFVGRLVDFKDPIAFIKAARLLSSNSPETIHQFTIAGDGELMKECQELARGYDNIHLLGWVKQEIVNDLMDQSDVFCQLSPYENIWAATLISALKHRKAVICTNVGYTSNFLKHGYHVILVPPRDPAALAEAITKLANDSKLRRVLGENAYSFVKEILGVDRIADEIHDLLIRTVEQWKQSQLA
jgi:glycosyltransferase involved in cell wall biosynthesis